MARSNKNKRNRIEERKRTLLNNVSVNKPNDF